MLGTNNLFSNSNFQNLVNVVAKYTKFWKSEFEKKLLVRFIDISLEFVYHMPTWGKQSALLDRFISIKASIRNIQKFTLKLIVLYLYFSIELQSMLMFEQFVRKHYIDSTNNQFSDQNF